MEKTKRIEDKDLMNTLDVKTQLRHALKAIDELTIENKKLSRIKIRKTIHELPNENHGEYNQGYVKCCNDSINRLTQQTKEQ